MSIKTFTKPTAEWAKAKTIRETYGITAPQLRRYAEDGLIRTSNIQRPGQTRGIRLFSMADLDRLIESSVENYARPRYPRSLSDAFGVVVSTAVERAMDFSGVVANVFHDVDFPTHRPGDFPMILRKPDYYAAASYLLACTETMLPVAESYATKAIELNTRVPLADYVLGNIAGQKGDHHAAIRHFDRVLELHPGTYIASHGKGLALGCMGRFKSAATEFEKFFAASRGMVFDSDFIEDSQGMYREYCAHLEKRTRAARGKAVKREMARVEAELGWCVELREDDPEVGPNSFAPTIIWRNHIPPGTVIIRGQSLELDDPDFLLCNLLEIRIETLAHQKQKHGRCPTLRQQAAHIAANCSEPQGSLSDELGSEEREILYTTRRNVCASAISEPLDWLIVARLIREFPACKWGLMFRMHEAVKLQIELCGDEMFWELFAPDIRTAYMAMVGAGALILEDLSNGALDLTAGCRQLPAWSRSVHIADHWKNRVEGRFKPGDEAALINEIAAIAGFIKGTQILTQGRLI